MSATSETPPHHPTYNVRLAETTISAIVGRVYPDGRLLGCHQLDSGKSFNNRIYFLDVEPRSGEGSRAPIKLVLKVCGQYFGANKVQNEISALLLLKHLCPTVPVSRPIAWSQTGNIISALHDGKIRYIADGSQPTTPDDFVACQGWVLQTRLPGRILTLEDLDGAHGASVLQQLAECMAAWRTQVPSPGLIGNMRFVEEGEPAISTAATSFLDITSQMSAAIGGLILTYKYSPAPLTSWAGYYRYKLIDQYEHLLGTPELSTLRSAIQTQISHFLPQLPKLPFLSDPGIRFSHMDFSPRNVLVSDDVSNSRLIVTGILDFEFAAFLPAPSEFLNSLVNQADDWPLHHYRTIMAELHRIESEASAPSKTGPSIAVPSIDPPPEECQNSDRCVCSYHTLQHLSALEGIIGCTAPWWINSTSHVGRDEELEKECQNAADTVLKGIQQLQVFFEEGTS